MPTSTPYEIKPGMVVERPLGKDIDDSAILATIALYEQVEAFESDPGANPDDILEILTGDFSWSVDQPDRERIKENVPYSVKIVTDKQGLEPELDLTLTRDTLPWKIPEYVEGDEILNLPDNKRSPREDEIYILYPINDPVDPVREAEVEKLITLFKQMEELRSDDLTSPEDHFNVLGGEYPLWTEVRSGFNKNFFLLKIKNEDSETVPLLEAIIPTIGYYPTPEQVVQRLLSGIDYKIVLSSFENSSFSKKTKEPYITAIDLEYQNYQGTEPEAIALLNFRGSFYTKPLISYKDQKKLQGTSNVEDALGFLAHEIKDKDLDSSEFVRSIPKERRSLIDKLKYFQEKVRSCNDLLTRGLEEGDYVDVDFSKYLPDFTEEELLYMSGLETPTEVHRGNNLHPTTEVMIEDDVYVQ